MRIGIVLGGGGVLGAAWLLGALHAIVDETGWEPTAADLVVGTSAGALVGALAANGSRPWDALTTPRGGFSSDLHGATRFRPTTPYRLRPGSWSMAKAAWQRRGSWAELFAGLAPAGVMSTTPIRRLIARQVPGGWPAAPRLWIVATDYESGERVTFGAPGAPPAPLPDAVAASCAVPGFYQPVTIAGRRYVDGGTRSAANLDLVAGSGLDLVLCLNPLSAEASAAVAPGVRTWRRRLRRMLMLEAEAVEAQGTRVVVIDPGRDLVRMMGINPMDGRRRRLVGQAAAVSVRETLSKLDLGELRAAAAAAASA